VIFYQNKTRWAITGSWEPLVYSIWNMWPMWLSFWGRFDLGPIWLSMIWPMIYESLPSKGK
jgi:hypothetical protein